MKTPRFWIGSFATVAMFALVLLTPKAAHAVVAALVQVVNTAASPAVSQDVSRLASQNVELVTSGGAAIAPHTSVSLYQIYPNGTISAVPFVVPSGQSLVITTVDLTPDGDFSGSMSVGIFNGPAALPHESFSFMDSIGAAPTVQFQFPNGLVFPGTATVTFLNYGISAGYVTPTLHGYLTSN